MISSVIKSQRSQNEMCPTIWLKYALGLKFGNRRNGETKIFDKSGLLFYYLTENL